jgi:hypothetical protein
MFKGAPLARPSAATATNRCRSLPGAGAATTALAGSFVGGLLVLAFALSLFGPLAELLHSLARK